MLRPGDAAPDFALPTAAGSSLRLSETGGASTFVFLLPGLKQPLSGMIARSLAAAQEALASHGAVAVGVTLDVVAEVAAFEARHAGPLQVVSDPDGHAHDLYEAWRTTLLGRSPWAARHVGYLIDGDGIIRRAYRPINPLTLGSQIRKDLDRLAAQRSWGKAKATLRDLKP